MFEQIDGTFQNGLLNHTTDIQQQYDSTHSLLAITLKEIINSASSITQTLSGQLADGQRKLLEIEDNSKVVVDPFVMQVNNYLHEITEDPTKELSRLINEQKFEEAFTRALYRSDVSIVSWLCSQAGLTGLLTMTPMPLSQGVLLSLLQQLSCGISQLSHAPDRPSISECNTPANASAAVTHVQVEVFAATREQKLLLDDIRKLSLWCDSSRDVHAEKESNSWMITGGRSMLVQGLKRELLSAQKSRKAASVALRLALQKAAQLRLAEKEKNKSPSYAMRISLQINKVVWSMLVDGKSFAEAEINGMIYDFDRDYNDAGVTIERKVDLIHF
ncbi:hypothetical protein KIW84_058032 [Lathyrus oleraceus]|uniref:Enhancer of mRNA-decapping protein 4 C-terminal domain-containing protein n=1 Tax=Pisum sativum TaxID=3888 RepID=A0A9D5ANR8_PEA|nr:hypothetical protein KIW84_058032 [Pisum sativum]